MITYVYVMLPSILGKNFKSIVRIFVYLPALQMAFVGFCPQLLLKLNDLFSVYVLVNHMSNITSRYSFLITV